MVRNSQVSEDSARLEHYSRTRLNRKVKCLTIILMFMRTNMMYLILKQLIRMRPLNIRLSDLMVLMLKNWCLYDLCFGVNGYITHAGLKAREGVVKSGL